LRNKNKINEAEKIELINEREILERGYHELKHNLERTEQRSRDLVEERARIDLVLESTVAENKALGQQQQELQGQMSNMAARLSNMFTVNQDLEERRENAENQRKMQVVRIRELDQAN
jgi:predicted nuclease with TOPRIM domain